MSQQHKITVSPPTMTATKAQTAVIADFEFTANKKPTAGKAPEMALSAALFLRYSCAPHMKIDSPTAYA
jgi:hypothetical protein